MAVASFFSILHSFYEEIHSIILHLKVIQKYFFMGFILSFSSLAWSWGIFATHFSAASANHIWPHCMALLFFATWVSVQGLPAWIHAKSKLQTLFPRMLMHAAWKGSFCKHLYQQDTIIFKNANMGGGWPKQTFEMWGTVDRKMLAAFA